MSSSPRVNSSPIALLGRRDHPTNALRDYCECLARAFERRGIHLEIVETFSQSRVGLTELLGLWHSSKDWRGRWILVQYTALSWSKRGFPIMFLFLLVLLKFRGARIAVVFHDPQTYSGSRFVDKARRACQRYVMSCAYGTATASILTIPLEEVPWIPRDGSKAVFIPVGSNVPPPASSILNAQNATRKKKTIAVFSMTDGALAPEIEDIAIAVKYAGQQIQTLRLVTLGRGSKRAEERLRQMLSGEQAEFVALGLLSPEEISNTLAGSDVLLFARGSLSAQRGSAIAGIACGLPIVAYSSSTPKLPLSAAGILFVPLGDREELSRATARVLTDAQLWKELHERSVCAYAKYFSWDAIAAKFAKILFNDAT